MLRRFEDFTAAISGIYRDIQKIERDEMESYGLKGAYAQYLLALSHSSDGLSAAELCEVCDKDKAAVSRVVAELESKGLLCRREGQYRVRLCLSEEGMKAADYVKERACIAVEAAGKGLSDEARRCLYSSLYTVAENLKTICREGLEK